MRTKGITENVFWFGGPLFSFYAVLGEKPALIELGISQLAPEIARCFSDVCGMPPATIIATHSHCDHAGGAARLKKIFHGSILAASEITARALRDANLVDSATGIMLRMNESSLIKKSYPVSDGVVENGPVETEIILDGSGEIALGGGDCIEYFPTPGHSKCSVSFFHRKSGALFASDACGTPLPTGRIWPAAFDDYGAYLDSMKKLLGLRPRFVCPGHYPFFPENRSIRFLEKSLQSAELFFEKINALVDRFGLDEEIVHRELKREYSEEARSIQSNVVEWGNREMIRQVIALRGKQQ